MSGFGYFYYNKKNSIIEKLNKVDMHYAYGYAYDYNEIPFYLKNNKMIKKAMENYEENLIDKICKKKMSLSSIKNIYNFIEKDPNFIKKLVEKSNNVFYMKYIKQHYTGKEFNELLKDLKLRKYLNANMIHHDFEYKIGINKDTQPFNTECNCCPGGLYFSNEVNIDHYIYCGDRKFEVEIPETAEVYIESEWKAKATEIRLVKEVIN